MVVGRRPASCWSSPAIGASCVPITQSDHPLRAWRCSASRWCCSSSAALEAHPAVERSAVTLPLDARRRAGRASSVERSRVALGFNGATLLLLALLAVGCRCCSACRGCSVMERIGAGVETLFARAAPPARASARPQDRRRRVAAERELVVEHAARGGVGARADRRRARRRRTCRNRSAVIERKQRPLFTDMPDSPLPPLSLLEDAPPATETVSAEDARIHVAADRAQARRLRRQR